MTTSDNLLDRTLPAGTGQQPRWSTAALLVVLAGVFLSMADFFIVNVALGDIAVRLHASTAALELVVAGYGLSYAVLLVVGGRLGDAFGRRRMFSVGLVLFVLTSLLCGLAPTVIWLVALRVLQGAAAALLVPQVLATIQASTTGRDRARAISMFGATGGLAAVIGQMVGGWLVSADLFGTGWRPIFLVNVPIGLVTLALVPRLVPQTRSPAPAGVDVPGTLLLGATVLALLLPLTEGRVQGWPLWSWLLLGCVPLLAVALARTEARAERVGRVPLLPPSLLRLPSVTRGLLVAVPFFAGFGGFMFVYAVSMQQLQGWSAVRAGLGLTPMAVAFLTSSLATPRLLARFGRRVVITGLLLQATGLIVLALTVWFRWHGLDPLDTAPGLLIAGAGQGMVMSPLMGLVISRVPVERAGIGSGVLTTAQQLALAIGAAGVGSLFAFLADPGRAGAATATAWLFAGQGALAVVLALVGRLLPDVGRG